MSARRKLSPLHTGLILAMLGVDLTTLKKDEYVEDVDGLYTCVRCRKENGPRMVVDCGCFP